MNVYEHLLPIIVVFPCPDVDSQILEFSRGDVPRPYDPVLDVFECLDHVGELAHRDVRSTLAKYLQDSL